MQLRASASGTLDMKRRITTILFFILVIAMILASFRSPENIAAQRKDKEWEKQLNEMNYLIMMISSVNIINGLYFSKEQAVLFQKYSLEFNSAGLPGLDTSASENDDLVKIRRIYIHLLSRLLQKDSIPYEFRKEVNAARIKESDIIKRSILGAQDRKNKDEGCMQCHCLPEYFPKGDISNKETKKISPDDRAAIDKAHVKGLFGSNGMLQLWLLKNKTDSTLTDGQRYIMKNFRCCLVPPNDLKDPTNIGQAFVSNEWINYFRKIRKFSDDEWKKYKDLFILPLDTLLRATLPGIQSSRLKQALSNAEKVVNDARALDAVDFELQKEKICLKMKDALKVTPSVSETSQEADIRKFTASMFLLFPGSDALYSKMAGNQ